MKKFNVLRYILHKYSFYNKIYYWWIKVIYYIYWKYKSKVRIASFYYFLWVIRGITYQGTCMYVRSTSRKFCTAARSNKDSRQEYKFIKNQLYNRKRYTFDYLDKGNNHTPKSSDTIYISLWFMIILYIIHRKSYYNNLNIILFIQNTSSTICRNCLCLDNAIIYSIQGWWTWWMLS